ncbi:MAG: DNA polymerase/3'-5' exonuclease PolX [Akkermansiaceae bacterium]|jgi:DNA polymerase (family X)|nr:DNA polymerase/3'-5' exonuclease PolX [Akkermansiaceae bacterium]MDG1852938.1 DNA polymerase/3'-5' exonuclease PolX [Verrucomicrobiales bacterium]
MDKRDLIADVLKKIAILLELKGENAFKIRAYRTGSEIVETYSGDIIKLALDDDLKNIKGIGTALAQKIHELAATGKLEYFENLKSEFPQSIFNLFNISNLGPKKIKILYDQLGIDSIPKLKQFCESGEVGEISGFGKKSVSKILDSISFHEDNANTFRSGDVAPIAENILEFLRSHPDTEQATIAGSYRRGKEILHDLDFIVSTKSPESIIHSFTNMNTVAEIISKGSTKSSIRLDNGLQCDLRAVSNAEYPFTLNYFTGSKGHNIQIRALALNKGYKLNEYGLIPKGDTDSSISDSIHTESDLYEALGLKMIHPCLRENSGEIEASSENKLPKLVTLENLRGTFHNHTTASDGKNTLEEMTEAAKDLGLQYLGISDHSKSSVQANGLSTERLLAQIKEIQSLNNSSPNDFRIFSGVECDILKDGTLDYDDEILAKLDYCVASIHSSFSLTEKEMTSRVIKAIENPNVTMIGHLTGRLLLSRKPYSINVPKVIDACASNHTHIEINANPRRLDMDWRWWRQAKDKGVKCSINPDAHRIEHFQFLHFGVKIAQKGWLESNDIINCLPLNEIESTLNKKQNL